MIDPLYLDTVTTNDTNQSWGEDQHLPASYSPQFETFDIHYFGKDPLSKTAQYKCPPVPTIQLIEPYFREDGTLVKAHFRTEADGFTENNLKP